MTSRGRFRYFMKNKSEVSEKFKEWKTHVEKSMRRIASA